MKKWPKYIPDEYVEDVMELTKWQLADIAWYLSLVWTGEDNHEKAFERLMEEHRALHKQ